MSDVDALRARLIADRLAAHESGAAVLAAVARVEHYNRQWDAGARDVGALTCPDNRLPIPLDLFRWMPVSDDAWDAVGAAEVAHGPGAVGWLSGVRDVLTAENAPEAGGTFVLEHALTDCSRQWRSMPDPRPRHPAAPLVDAWQRWKAAQGDLPDRVHVIVTRERRPPPKAEPLTLARMPGLLALTLAPLEAVEVDGAPLVSATPDARRRYRVLPAQQGELFAAPRTLDKRATGGALVEAVASVPLGGDERNPIRADLLRIGTLSYALTGSVRLTPGEMSTLIVGRDTPQGRAQGLALVWLMRSIAIAPAGEPWAAFDAEPGAVHRIGPPRWWLDQTGPRAYRLVGALFRRILGTGRKAARWGVLERTIAGIEGALLWGPSAGKGRRGRTPDAVRAVRRGGPGAPVTVAWHHLLRLSGEHVTPEMLADPAKRDTLNRRFNRRIDALEAAGYKVGKDGPAAPAGDTIEIVKVVKGGRHHEACIVVRATARFCAAYAPGAERTRLPASHLLLP